MSKHHRCPICHDEWDHCAHTDTDVTTWREQHGKKSLEHRFAELEARVKLLEDHRANSSPWSRLGL
jgi:hypothetical protein